MADTLSIDEIEPQFGVDRTGFTFKHNGAFFRAINDNAIPHVRKLLASGLIQRLIEEDLFPETSETTLTLEGHSYVLKHELIKPISYPWEWSFNMLKDAGKAILQVNDLALAYGYQVIDAHPRNIVYRRNKPVWVDLGSFIPHANPSLASWRGYAEYILCVLLPLKVWSKGHEDLARLMLFRPTGVVDALRLKSIGSPSVFPRLSSRLWCAWNYCWKAVYALEDEDIRNQLCHTWARRVFAELIIRLKNNGLCPFGTVNKKRLAYKAGAVSEPRNPTLWSNYQRKTTFSSSRFPRICELAAKYHVTSAVEIGGNSGVFSDMLEKGSGVSRVICTDRDANAIDVLYKRLRSGSNGCITPMVYDFVRPLNHTGLDNTVTRVQSDAVFALALTHHLILGQNRTLDDVLVNLRKHTKRLAFVEFMPLGLHTGRHARSPTPPDWYHLEWFREGFRRWYQILHEEELEPNRVLFVGRVNS